MTSKIILKYRCEVEDGRVFVTRQPYKTIVNNKVIKITKVFLMIFKKVIYNIKGEK